MEKHISRSFTQLLNHGDSKPQCGRGSRVGHTRCKNAPNVRVIFQASCTRARTTKMREFRGGYSDAGLGGGATPTPWGALSGRLPLGNRVERTHGDGSGVGPGEIRAIIGTRNLEKPLLEFHGRKGSHAVTPRGVLVRRIRYI